MSEVVQDGLPMILDFSDITADDLAHALVAELGLDGARKAAAEMLAYMRKAIADINRQDEQACPRCNPKIREASCVT